MKKMLFELCKQTGVSGRENEIARYIYNQLKQITGETAEVCLDPAGNVTAYLNRNQGQTILLDAHMDQIGLIVTCVEENGFLRVAKCGGVDARVLGGSPVMVHGTKSVLGIVSSIPPHLSEGDGSNVIPVENVLIDTGLTTEQCRAVVSPGDVITLYHNPIELNNGRVACGAVDNRAGVAVLLQCAKKLNKKELPCNVVFLFSSQEETYGKGAKTASYGLNPDECIVVDTGFGDQIGLDNYHTPGVLGGGPMICYASTLSKQISDTLITVAKNANISFQREVCGGATGTNADYIAVSNTGVKTGLVSVPIRNMHTQSEVVTVQDMEDTVRLLCDYILQGGLQHA